MSVEFSNEADPLIQRHLELKTKMDELKKEDDDIKAQVRLLMQSHAYETYKDSVGNSISCKPQMRENVNKKLLKDILSEVDYNRVVTKKETVPVLKILSVESQEKMKDAMQRRQA